MSSREVWSNLSVSVRPYKSDRKTLLPLLSLADDSPSQVMSYYKQGEVLAAYRGDLLIGHAQIIEAHTGDECELKTIAVTPEWQHRGVGLCLVEAAIKFCHERACRRLIVATATADIENLRFYQRRGFRMFQIIQDAFSAENGYAQDTTIHGIPLRDQVWFEMGQF